LHGLRGNVSAHAGAAVHGDDNAALENKAKGGCAVQKFYVGFAFAVFEGGS
jgi:hypothetical protein